VNNAIFEIQLPFPPSVNHMYRAGFGGKRLLTRQAKSFRNSVCLIVLDKCNRVESPLPIVGSIWVSIIANFPNNDRKRDIDNLLKATLDALQAAKVFCDDSQVGRLTIERAVNVNDGSMDVKVGRLGPS
jgi:crossover junction endodeoxyribonuclease RusA